MHQRPLISVALLSHNRPATLGRAIESVLGQTYRPIELIVVDNPSPRTAEIESLVARYEGVRFIRNPRNLGFSGGINVGINAATGPLTYVTEDDIVLEPECLSLLQRHLASHPDIGFATAMLLDERTRSILSAGGEYELGPIFKLRFHGHGEVDRGQFQEPFDAPYVLGGALLASTAFLRELGAFRDDFVLYYEDLELCVRASAAGKRLTVVPAAKALHLQAPPSPPSLPVEFHRIKNLFALYLLHARWTAFPGFVARFGVMDFLRSLRSNPRRALLHLRSAAWISANLPRLLAQRRVGRRPGGPRS